MYEPAQLHEYRFRTGARQHVQVVVGYLLFMLVLVLVVVAEMNYSGVPLRQFPAVAVQNPLWGGGLVVIGGAATVICMYFLLRDEEIVVSETLISMSKKLGPWTVERNSIDIVGAAPIEVRLEAHSKEWRGYQVVAGVGDQSLVVASSVPMATATRCKCWLATVPPLSTRVAMV